MFGRVWICKHSQLTCRPVAAQFNFLTFFTQYSLASIRRPRPCTHQKIIKIRKYATSCAIWVRQIYYFLACWEINSIEVRPSPEICQFFVKIGRGLICAIFYCKYFEIRGLNLKSVPLGLHGRVRSCIIYNYLWPKVPRIARCWRVEMMSNYAFFASLHAA